MLRQARAGLLSPLCSLHPAHSLWAASGSKLRPDQQQQARAAERPQRSLSVVAATTDGSSSSGGSGSSSNSSSSSSGAPTAASSTAPPKPRQAFKYCRMCGGPLELVLPEGDGAWRHVCSRCSYVDYQNPKMVVGCIVQHEGKILLCRRGIEPQRGLWTVPAGFLECGESSAEGAARETWEEAGARVHIDAPYCHFDIPGISQVYLLFRGRLAEPFTFAARAPESLEARLFAPEDLPWDQLAFSSVSIALQSYVADLASGQFTVHHGVIIKRPGSGPNEPGSFTLADHFELPTTLPTIR